VLTLGTLLAALVAALLAAPGGAAPRAVASQDVHCAGADVLPQDALPLAAETATLCLLNAERRARGMARLGMNQQLRRAALGHARDMVDRGYFSHESRDGRDFVDRIVRARYVRMSDPGWLLGENLAWGAGRLASPREIVRAWMASPGHRANVLRRRFRDVGIAVVAGTPVEGTGVGATYATDFGRRRR